VCSSDLGLVANAEESDVDRVISSLIENRKITTSFLLRAICTGNITLFARSLSQLSQMPARRVEAMLANDKQAALKAVYAKAGLPESAFGVFLSAISAWRRLLSSGEPHSASRLSYLVTRETLETYSKTRGMSVSAVTDNLLVLLRKLAAETARESALARVNEIQHRNINRQVAALPVPSIAAIDMDEFEKEMQDQEFTDEFEIEFQSILKDELSDMFEEYSDFISDKEFELEFEVIFNQSAENLNEEISQPETIVAEFGAKLHGGLAA